MDNKTKKNTEENKIRYTILEPSKNDFNFTNPENWTELYKKMNDFIKKYTKTYETTLDEKNMYITEICKQLKNHRNDTLNTINLATYENNLYQIMYVHKHYVIEELVKNNNNKSFKIDVKELEKIKDIPIINSFINALQTHVIYGRVAILVHKINDNFTCSPDIMTDQKIKELIYDRMYHKSIFIGSDNKTRQIELFNNIPLAIEKYVTKNNLQNGLKWLKSHKIINHINLKLTDGDNGNYMIEMYFVDDNLKINNIATRLSGKLITGSVILVCKDENELYQNFYIKELDNLNTIYTLMINDFKLNKRELLPERINTLQVVKNKYYCLKKQFGKVEKKCYTCGLNPKKNIKIYNCQGCYRITYCSAKCQRKDFPRHKIDCLFNKMKLLTLLRDGFAKYYPINICGSIIKYIIEGKN